VYGEMFVWGRGFYGETGLGDHEFRYKPTKLPGNKVWLKAAGTGTIPIDQELIHRSRRYIFLNE
jgi:hypothetical protein